MSVNLGLIVRATAYYGLAASRFHEVSAVFLVFAISIIKSCERTNVRG